MASLTKINGRYHVRIRRKGFKTRCRNFTQKADALKWLRDTEIAIEQGRVTSRDTTLGTLINRYIDTAGAMCISEEAGGFLGMGLQSQTPS
jgi:hypothetical protein